MELTNPPKTDLNVFRPMSPPVPVLRLELVRRNWDCVDAGVVGLECVADTASSSDVPRPAPQLESKTGVLGDW